MIENPLIFVGIGAGGAIAFGFVANGLLRKRAESQGKLYSAGATMTHCALVTYSYKSAETISYDPYYGILMSAGCKDFFTETQVMQHVGGLVKLLKEAK